MTDAPLPPMMPPRPGAGEGIDYDKPVGYAHALAILTARPTGKAT